jgi:hypothetical protein
MPESRPEILVENEYILCYFFRRFSDLELEENDITDLGDETPEEGLATVGSGKTVVLVVLDRRF